MLEKIICIDNIGVIKSGIPQALSLKKVTLVYADNARGKSTLAALLNACALASTPDLVKYKTIGATSNQKIHFRFSEPSGSFNSEFDGKAWVGQQPKLYVFNQDFVERNIYSGKDVSAEQRASLLELALGDAAVAEQAEFAKLSGLQRNKASDIRIAEAAVAGYCGDLTVNDFIALPEAPNADAEIQALDRQIADAKGIDVILARPDFKKLTAPTFDLENFKAVARSHFEQVQDGAEDLVLKHLNAHMGAATELWISTGLQHKPEPDCPFCGQKTGGIELVHAYKTYFNQTYKDYLSRIGIMGSIASQSVSADAISNWSEVQGFNEGVAGRWNDAIEFTLPFIDFLRGEKIIQSAQKALTEVAENKKLRPLESIDDGFVVAIEGQLDAISTMVTFYNTEIEAINTKIAFHKKSLSTSDIKVLIAQKKNLELRRIRHEPKVKAMVDLVTVSRNEYRQIETAKNTAKANLDGLMSNLLETFQSDINDWLMRFGAPFSIEKLTTSYANGDPRGRYAINVRGATVNVGPGTPGELSFHAALSEGDKRTLAFAFFLTKLFTDPKRNLATIVLDDVFTSLDHHRRHNTIEAAVRMAQECAQVIALGHDAHFLRELRRWVKRKSVGESLELCLCRDANNYSFLTGFDLDEFCASDYYKNYVLIEQYLDGKVSPEKLLGVAQALRPLVEGHMHKSFPKKFKDGQTVGEMLDIVKNATGNSSLKALQPLRKDLSTFNDFAATFHHDTTGGHPRQITTDQEVHHYARAALNFIQSRKLW